MTGEMGGGGGRKGMLESEHEERTGQMVMTSNAGDRQRRDKRCDRKTNWAYDDAKQQCDKQW